jgi:DNA (cytosine-5)-methyltransferase 1
LTLGAARAGFHVAAAVDHDPRTGLAFQTNFPRYRYIEADIAELSGKGLLEKAETNRETIDGIIGGPPCQGFSRIGRRTPDDKRNNLFDDFFRIVEELRPTFYLAENVLGICDSQFDAIRETAMRRLCGYVQIGPLPLKASDYGAATNRERVFFLGVLKERANGISEETFAPPADVAEVTVGMALQGLRRSINPDWQAESDGWRRVTPHTDGRFWKRIAECIPDGVGDAEAIRLLQQEQLVSGCLGTRHTKAVAERFARVPEGSVDKPSRSVRLSRNGFCPTLRAGTGPERGSFQALRPIHPTEPRVITPREAARLQGFPDWFQFDSTKWHSFKQIGNSVSPILAEAVLGIIADNILGKEKQNGN